MVSPTRRRDAVAYLVGRHGVSERRACKVVGQHRSTQRYDAVASDFETRLVREMRALAEKHPRFGYRMVHAMLVEAGWAINRKRVERLWRLEGLRVPPSKRSYGGADAVGVDENAAWNLPSVRPDHVWSYDFVSLRRADGGALRVLNVVDEFTRECVGFHVASTIGAGEIIRFLTKLFAERKPTVIRSDNGREFIAASVVAFLAGQGVRAAFIAKASPQQNCYVERFNGTMRDQLLNGEEFHSLAEARVVIGEWIVLYNTVRPHRALGMRPPARFAAEWTPDQPSPPPARVPRSGRALPAKASEADPVSPKLLPGEGSG